MPRHLAFLRGINLGRRRIKMEDLRRHFGALGFTAVETFIASDNVIFDSPTKSDAKLSALIASPLEKTLEYGIGIFVRTWAEVATIAAFRPFSVADLDLPENTAHSGFLGAPLSAAHAAGHVRSRLDCAHRTAPLFVMRLVTDFTARSATGLADTTRPTAENESL